jgi:hypothetical protein
MSYNIVIGGERWIIAGTLFVRFTGFLLVLVKCICLLILLLKTCWPGSLGWRIVMLFSLEIAKLLQAVVIERDKYHALDDVEYDILDEVAIGLYHAFENARKLEDS